MYSTNIFKVPAVQVPPAIVTVTLPELVVWLKVVEANWMSNPVKSALSIAVADLIVTPPTASAKVPELVLAKLAPSVHAFVIIAPLGTIALLWGVIAPAAPPSTAKS